MKLSDFRGKAVVLNFWATYCGPCRVEMPWLRDLYKQYHESGFEIIGISMDDAGEEKRVADFVHEIGVDYTIVIGNHAIGDAYGGVRFLPQTFLIDRNGHVAASGIGMKSKKEFESSIVELLNNTEATSKRALPQKCLPSGSLRQEILSTTFEAKLSKRGRRFYRKLEI